MAPPGSKSSNDGGDSERQALVDSGIDFDALKQVFKAQTREILSVVEASLMALEEDPDDAEALSELLRSVHTIKGDAGTLGFNALMNAAHRLEDSFELLKTGDLKTSSKTTTILLEAVDLLRSLTDAEDHEAPPSDREMEEILAILTVSPEGQAATALRSKEAARTRDRDSKRASEGIRGHWSRTMRVNIERLDQLITLTGELAVVRGRMTDLMDASDSDRSTLRDLHEESDALHTRLQSLVTDLRMVPLGPRFQHLFRVVRDLSTSLGKEAGFTLHGSEVEVDNSVLEALGEPVAHLIRNAVDHGLEDPATRQRAGKPPAGEIQLRAWHEGSSVLLEIRDDGRGIDRQDVLQRAQDAGLADKERTYSDAEIDRFLFRSGFTTADSITEVSGRGVGLDAVLAAVEGLRGEVIVRSDPGVGTAVTIKLPLSLTLVEGLQVRSGSETYLVPIDSVIETAELPSSRTRKERGVFNLRGLPVPFARLGGLFGLGGEIAAQEIVLIVPMGENRAGLVVDSIEGQAQAVVKPLAPFLRRIPGLSGTTILGSGDVALLLDVPALLRQEIDTSRLARAVDSVGSVVAATHSSGSGQGSG